MTRILSCYKKQTNKKTKQDLSPHLTKMEFLDDERKQTSTEDSLQVFS